MTSPKSVTLTRKELYARVWATPIDRLAREFGISGVGLAKICARLQVPVPPRGHWAKLRAGKLSRQAPLPPAPPPDVTITATERPAPAAAAQEAAEPNAPEAADGVIEVPVSDSLRKPHRIVAAWLAQDRQNAECARRWNSSYRPTVNSEIARRRLRLLSALYSAIEARGDAVSTERGSCTTWSSSSMARS